MKKQKNKKNLLKYKKALSLQPQNKEMMFFKK
jgi:hypothetical protein